ncbi:MAG: hypothetical protein WA921_08375 [Ahrensia sp.]
MGDVAASASVIPAFFPGVAHFSRRHSGRASDPEPSAVGYQNVTNDV